MKRLLLLIVPLLLISCASEQPSLSQKLAGKSAPERQRILLTECRNEAETRSGLHSFTNMYQHVHKSLEICDAMAEEMRKQ